MTEIYRDEQTVISQEAATLKIEQGGIVTTVSAGDLETIAELAPCATFGKWADLHIVAIRAKQRPTLYVPTTKDGAKRLLSCLQQFRLDSRRMTTALQ